MYSVGVFIDLKKAFDTIDHKLLIQKIQHFRIRGEPNKKVLPPNIMNYYKMIKKYSYKTRHTQDLKQVYTHTTHKSMNISIYGVKLCNQFEKN